MPALRNASPARAPACPRPVDAAGPSGRCGRCGRTKPRLTTGIENLAAVVITRRRHPLEGWAVPVLGRMRRHGQLELLLVLPDGSKSLIPSAWTDLEEPTNEETVHAPATLGGMPYR